MLTRSQDFGLQPKIHLNSCTRRRKLSSVREFVSNWVQESITKSKKGMEAALYTTSEHWGSGTCLLAINLHLDPYGDKIPKQMNQLLDFIKRLLTTIDSKFDTKIPFSKIGILLLGDWNIGKKHSSYDHLFKIFNHKIRELCDKEYKPTFESTANSYIPKDWQHVDKLDHMFVVDEIQMENGKKITLLPLEAAEVTVLTQEFQYEWSDHWAQSAKIRPKTL